MAKKDSKKKDKVSTKKRVAILEKKFRRLDKQVNNQIEQLSERNAATLRKVKSGKTSAG
jgi:hypothetical protein